MSKVSPQQLVDIQQKQLIPELNKSISKNIRNFCILAHVDHGKTTLSDSLISSNGIISENLAGKVRFLDHTEEEQKRGITMHSSAITLHFNMEDPAGPSSPAGAASGETSEYLITLIDSPGHIDFSSDVSTATRVSDGALIVVDAVEGVCTQTHAVVFKALRERMKPCLLINKIDKLIVELQLTPLEAWNHLRRLIEQVNALAFSLVQSEIMKYQQEFQEQDSELVEFFNNNESSIWKDFVDPILKVEQNPDEDHPLVLEWSFSPFNGNVLFASAIDSWGLNCLKFVNQLGNKYGLNKGVLKKYFFEDYCLNPETKKIIKYDSSSDLLPMFPQYVLKPIWELYQKTICAPPNTFNSQEIVAFAKENMKVTLTERESKLRDPRQILQIIMRRYLPLADSVLRVVVRIMLPPCEAQKRRISTLYDLNQLKKKIKHISDINNSSDESKEVISTIENVISSVKDCSTYTSDNKEAPLTIFISKMITVKASELSKRDLEILNKQRLDKYNKLYKDTENPPPPPSPLRPLDDEVFVALGRIFSGVLHRNSKLSILGHKHDPLNKFIKNDIDFNSNSVTMVGEGEGNDDNFGLYLMLGPSIFPTESVGAGNVIGIVGLEDYFMKSATMSSTISSPPFQMITFQCKPMLKVALEPVRYSDLKLLERGLEQLYQYDPVVEINVSNSGEHTMTCLGELHLDQCIKALKEKFAKCEITVSEPLISFKETIIPFSEESNSNSESGVSNFTNNLSIDSELQLPPPWSDLPSLSFSKGGRFRIVTDARNLSITIKAFSIPVTAMNILTESDSSSSENKNTTSDAVWNISHFLSSAYEKHSLTGFSDVSEAELDNFIQSHSHIKTLWESFLAELETSKKYIVQSLGTDESKFVSTLTKNAITFGPKSMPSNFLFFNEDVELEIFFSQVASNSLSSEPNQPTSEDQNEHQYNIASPSVSKISRKNNFSLFMKLWNRIHNSFIAAFQEATSAGPLMHEPLFSTGFVIEKIEYSTSIIEGIKLDEAEKEIIFPSSIVSSLSFPTPSPKFNPYLNSAQLISDVYEGIHLAILSCPVRIVEPLYQCELQCDQSQLGNLYGVLGKRNAEIINEDIIEGTTLFLLTAYLPVKNSFQFAQELLKKTSGNGTTPTLSFAKWKVLEVDPFWRPRKEDELEEYGEEYLDNHNAAKSWINKIRKRKGLQVDEQVVVSAEKQRTLNKKK